MTVTKKAVAIARAAAGLRSVQEGLVPFAERLVIPSQGKGVVRLSTIMEQFQRDRFELLEPSLMAMMNKLIPAYPNFWIEATKGAAKDADIAIIILWSMLRTKHPIRCQVGAGDADQAGIVRERAKGLLHHNEWLANVIKIQRNTILCALTGSECKIETADAGTAHGTTPDLLIMNELHVTSEEFAGTAFANAAKVAHGVAIAATNAGARNTWQWKWRENAIKSEKAKDGRWRCHIWDRPSPWTTAKKLEDERARNPIEFNRLWLGQWASDDGDGFPYDQVEWCMTRHEGPLMAPDVVWTHFLAGLDYGIKNDHAAFVVIGLDLINLRMRIAKTFRWRPEDFKAGLMHQHVQEIVWDTCRQFRVTAFRYDPYQFASQAEWLSCQVDKETGWKIPVVDEYLPQKPANLTAMALSMVRAFGDGILEGYPNEALRNDLLSMRVVDRPGHCCMLKAPKDEITGHADEGMALAIAVAGGVDTLDEIRRMREEHAAA